MLTDPPPPRWELAAERIAVKIRWTGLLLGYAYVNLAAAADRLPLNAILAVGAAYTALDTVSSLRGRVFLGRYPLSVSFLEAVFIGWLCYFDGGLGSPFRYYYLLSLVCCAIRHPARTTWATCGFDAASYSLLYAASPAAGRDTLGLVLTLTVMGWVSYAAVALTGVLKAARENLRQLNDALEERVAAARRELQEAQGMLWHQEKMAAFGLLAAGIAHEVGNPLASISSVVQLLQHRGADDYTRDRLTLVNGQLSRIQTTLKELINFSRPASAERGRFDLADVVHEALGIAKYSKGMKARQVVAALPADLPPVAGVRDQLVQVVLNLVLNAVDATRKGGRIEITAAREAGGVVVRVKDDGEGIAPENAARLFQPYFTTKKHGTGLGLFVTGRMVKQHGGTIDFTSEPGRGTEFRVRLPVGGAVPT